MIINLLLIFIALALPLLWLYMIKQGAPYRVSQDEAIKNMLQLAGNIKGKQVAELGCGDGRVVIALAKAGAIVEGYEINPFLVLLGRWKIKKARVSRAVIHWQNFWSVDLNGFDTLVVFQLPSFMKRLKRKLEQEVKKEIAVITNCFPLPGHKTIRQHGTVELGLFKPV